MAGELFAQHHALIGRFVRVEAADRTFVNGVLYCIDPESDAVVLLLLREGDEEDKQWGVKVFLGHSVLAIHEDDSSSVSLDSIREKLTASSSDGELGAEDASERRERLCLLLTQSFVPWVDEGEGGIAVFGGAAHVRSPFTSESVESANEQILAKLQQLVARIGS